MIEGEMMVDDADLLAAWLHELAGPAPDASLVAALEADAEDRGWHPYDALQALTAARFRDKLKKALGGFDPDLHPRGKDGQFIEGGGTVRLEGRIDLPNGGKFDATGVRGQVDSIIPDPKSPGRPTIRVRVTTPDGRTGTVDVKPNQVTAAPEKARLDRNRFDERAGNRAMERAGQQPEQVLGRRPDRNYPPPLPPGPARNYPPPLPPARPAAVEQPPVTQRLLDGTAVEEGATVRWKDGYYVVSRSPEGDNSLVWFRDADGKEVNVGPNESGLKGPVNGEQPTAIWRHQGNKTYVKVTNDDGGSIVWVEPGPGKDPINVDRKTLTTLPLSPSEQWQANRLADAKQRQRRDAASKARGLSDEELAAQAETGGDTPLIQAIRTEQANRVAYRAKEQAARDKLIASVNEQAAALSTTDPEERAKGLDKILAKLRFSIVDTDKVHDHIYPPGESGRWTPERSAQHEAMWDDLLSQVQAAGVPQDHDALVLGGLPGAGKSYMLRPGQKAASFGVVSWEPGQPIPDGTTHVSINPDIVKEMLIERGMLPEGISPDLKPMEQVTFLHEESSAIAKMFSKRLGDLGYNVVLDNTMDSEGGMLKRMTPLARQGYKFRGIFADIPQEESLASAKQRYIDSALTPQGGRFVPSSVQGNRKSSKGNLSKNRDAMDSLVDQDWFTEYMIVDNTGISTRTPKGDIVAQGTGAGSAADRYLPGNDAALPKAGPQAPAAAEAPPTITV